VRALELMASHEIGKTAPQPEASAERRLAHSVF
jgi:hypothetical protein